TRISRTDIIRKDTDLMGIVRDACDELAPLAKAKGIRLMASGKKTIAPADAQLMAIAVKNLVSNAIKFTEKGRVSARAYKSGKNAIIVVSDTGIGISRENQRRLFKNFFKVDETKVGTGIGLVGVKGIMLKHKGSISVKSALGKGSIFTLKLPLGWQRP
ncbi:MAG TPA: HAMP domain-containing sensor histidine kinase, partial [Candidatus Micrarchaeota archaeon]|nr:HAMP domain-containing sensor histidine kinase [Candidatus Micrarchaeota archaeon]